MSDVHSDCTGYPLGVGKATGLRSFNVDGFGRLRGVAYPQLWTPGENVARCGAKTGRCESKSCGCGFWAYHDGSEYPEGHVTGVIQGYGKTTVGPRGFRCEKAEVVALCIPDDTATAKPKAEPKRSRWDRFCIWADAHAWIGLIATGVGILATYAGLAAVEQYPQLSLGAGVLFLACAVVVRAMFRGVDVRPATGSSYITFNYHIADDKNERLSLALVPKVRRNYPDLPVYGSLAAMTKAHPLDPTPEPTPETDPDFWTVETVTPSGSFVPLSITAQMFAAAYPKNALLSAQVSSDQCPCGCDRDDSLDCTEDTEDDES